MTVSTRTRDITVQVGPWRLKRNTENISDPSQSNQQDSQWVEMEPLRGTQKTVSEGHPFHSRSKGVKGDIGGEFYSEMLRYDQLKGRNVTIEAYKQLGELIHTDYAIMPAFPVDPYTLVFPGPVRSSNDALDAFGATAIARCKPTNSVADAATFLGETLKDGLPHLVGSQTWEPRTRAAKKAGHEFLNVEFGWKPLLNDIRSFATAVKHAHSVISQFERDSGKTVRRRFNFPEQKTVTESIYSEHQRAWLPAAQTYWLTPAEGRVTKTVETVTRRWFSGAFTYHVPLGSDTRSTMERYALEADKLFGILPTPETLWELAPWSWAVDWFSNTGDVVSNLSDWAIYGLVMRYGYMMEHSIVKHTYTYEGDSGWLGLEDFIQPISLVREVKMRRKANPFGFGVSWEGLSPIQLLITAALGLTRGLK